jgi:hypothetical protein
MTTTRSAPDTQIAPARHRPLVRAIWTASVLVVLALVSYALGAAALTFDLPSAHFLNDAFDGGAAWWEKVHPEPEEEPPTWPQVRELDVPAKTCDGFTLYTTIANPRALLVDMNGKEVHVWERSFSKTWPKPAHVKQPVDDKQIYYCGCRLFPDGRLLVIFQATGDTPYGYGLAMLDKDSNVLWTFDENVHHELDIAENGDIYVLTHRIAKQVPQGLEFIPLPSLVDDLVVLSPDGKERKRVPILEAFLNSPYRFMLDQIKNQPEPPKFGQPGGPPVPVKSRGVNSKGDILHTNYINILTGKMARSFPMFRAGQVLISSRELSALAVLDIESGKVEWAALGPWQGQHCPTFLENGNILLLDNHGNPMNSRVIEYDPRNQAFPWWEPKVPGTFQTKVRGLVQRLPNQNTFIVDSEVGDLREVTPDGEQVWVLKLYRHVPSGRRYRADELTFLNGRKPR